MIMVKGSCVCVIGVFWKLTCEEVGVCVFKPVLSLRQADTNNKQAHPNPCVYSLITFPSFSLLSFAAGEHRRP